MSIFFKKEELTDPQGNQIQPPGFQLIMLPYADEIRPVPPVVTHIKGKNNNSWRIYHTINHTVL